MLGRGIIHKSAKRTAVAVEQLDHRRLLSVNFTGNVETDFLPTESKTFSVPASYLPIIPAYLSSLISNSGYGISELAVSYDPADDTLSVGLDGPPANPSNPNSGPVIAGDADNNGNAGNVNPAVLCWTRCLPNSLGLRATTSRWVPSST